MVREQTVKAVLTIINKLSDRTINGELLKYLAKTSNDEQPGIRTNTTICLGKISKNLGVSTRSKVLIAAFTRSLRDPFVHARNASLLALGATSDVFSDEDCASKILPALCPSLVDKEKLVRDQANKCVDLYLNKVRKAGSQMPDTVLPPANASESSGQTPRMGTPQPNEGSSWTGWAISSFTNKVSAAAGEITANGLATPSERPGSAPASELRRPNLGTSSASALHRQAIVSPAPLSGRTSISSNANDYFADANEEADDFGDAWGDMDDDDDATGVEESEEKSTQSTTTTTIRQKPTTTASTYDDGGEPDFAGWLAAQANKKPQGKALPKGLTKTSVPAASNRPAANRIASTGAVGTGLGAKKASATAIKPVPKKIDTAPKDTGDDDGWGEGW